MSLLDLEGGGAARGCVGLFGGNCFPKIEDRGSVVMWRKFLERFNATDMAKYIENLRYERYTPGWLRADDYAVIVSRYQEAFVTAPDFHCPTRFSEKLQWLKLFYRNSDMPVCTDKYAVRAYLEERGYGYLLNNLIGVYEHPNEIDFRALPNRFVLKASHGSTWNLICCDKKKLNWFLWKRITASWLRQNFVVHGREWNYREIKPRLVIEEYLEDDSGQLRDFKVFCMNGRATSMLIAANRHFGEQRRSFVARDGSVMGTVDKYPRLDEIKAEWPIDEMFRLAEELSKPFPHVRLDFYALRKRIVFGEFTFFDGSGFYGFEPPEEDVRWGEQLLLPEPNHNLDLYRRVAGTPGGDAQVGEVVPDIGVPFEAGTEEHHDRA